MSEPNDARRPAADSAETGELLKRVGMLATDGSIRRSNPLSNPVAFRELARRLVEVVDQGFDLVVVRDLFGDRVLGYQISLLTGSPVAVSYDREGLISLGDHGVNLEGNRRVLIAADVHFTIQSVRAAAYATERTGLEVVGAATMIRTVGGGYPFPTWTLEDHARNS